jgi:hypothetical protein
MRILQVTLGAAATQLTTNPKLYASALIFQDNAAANVRLGDNTVSSTKGILLSPSGSLTVLVFPFHGTHLVDWYLYGTSGNVIDVLYEEAN